MESQKKSPGSFSSLYGKEGFAISERSSGSKIENGTQKLHVLTLCQISSMRPGHNIACCSTKLDWQQDGFIFLIYFRNLNKKKNTSLCIGIFSYHSKTQTCECTESTSKVFSFALRFKEKQTKLCLHSRIGENGKMRLACAFCYYLFAFLMCLR